MLSRKGCTYLAWLDVADIVCVCVCVFVVADANNAKGRPICVCVTSSWEASLWVTDK